MTITDVCYKNGKMKSGKALVNAIHWTDIQGQMKDLSWQQFKEVVFPIIKHFKERGA
jgi:hypothetical protein